MHRANELGANIKNLCFPNATPMISTFVTSNKSALGGALRGGLRWGNFIGIANSAMETSVGDARFFGQCVALASAMKSAPKVRNDCFLIGSNDFESRRSRKLVPKAMP